MLCDAVSYLGIRVSGVQHHVSCSSQGVELHQLHLGLGYWLLVVVKVSDGHREGDVGTARLVQADRLFNGALGAVGLGTLEVYRSRFLSVTILGYSYLVITICLDTEANFTFLIGEIL